VKKLNNLYPSIVYLGRRGGGAHLALALFENLKSLKPEIIYSNKNLFLEEKLKCGIPNIPSGLFQNLLTNILPFQKNKLVENITKEITGGLVLFVMPHPLNLEIISKLRERKIFIILHEVRKHQGDFWPTNRFLARYALQKKCNIITLSKFVAKELKKNFGLSSTVLPLIVPDYKKYYSFEQKKNLDVIYVGRNKKYKNYRFLVEGLLGLSENISLMLNIPKKYHKFFSERKNIELRSNFLDESSFLSAIANAKVVAMSHKTASQSGIIPTALYFGTKVVCPNVGGLSEQFTELQGSVYDSASKADFVLKIEKELTKVSEGFMQDRNVSQSWVRFMSEELSR